MFDIFRAESFAGNKTKHRLKSVTSALHEMALKCLDYGLKTKHLRLVIKL